MPRLNDLRISITREPPNGFLVEWSFGLDMPYGKEYKPTLDEAKQLAYTLIEQFHLAL